MYKLLVFFTLTVYLNYACTGECELKTYVTIADLREEIIVPIQIEECSVVDKKIRATPIASGAIIKIYNLESDSWIGQNAKISDLPFCRKYMFLKIFPTNVKEIDISVSITGNGYNKGCTKFTASLKNTADIENTLPEINKSIMSIADTHEIEKAKESTQSTLINENTPYKPSPFIYLAIFISALFGGFTRKVVQYNNGQKVQKLDTGSSSDGNHIHTILDPG